MSEKPRKYRKQAHHFRHLPTGVVEINRDVNYDDTTSGPADVSGVRHGVNGLVGTPPRFPDERFRLQAKRSLVSRMKDRLVGKRVERSMFNGLYTKDYIMQHKVWISPSTGKGTLLWRTEPDGKWNKAPLGPGVELGGALMCGAELPLVDLSEGEIKFRHLTDINLQGAKLDDIKLSFVEIGDVNMDGASVRGVVFPLSSLTGNVSLVGADVTDSDFSGILMISSAFHIDFTDSNVTGEQVGEIEREAANVFNLSVLPLRYRKYSLSETEKTTGMSSDELGVRVWSGEIEARLNDSNRKAETFDADTCHIPQWEVDRLIAENSAS
jgi:hypothetical protein